MPAFRLFLRAQLFCTGTHTFSMNHFLFAAIEAQTLQRETLARYDVKTAKIHFPFHIASRCLLLTLGLHLYHLVSGR